MDKIMPLTPISGNRSLKVRQAFKSPLLTASTQNSEILGGKRNFSKSTVCNQNSEENLDSDILVSKSADSPTSSKLKRRCTKISFKSPCSSHKNGKKTDLNLNEEYRKLNERNDELEEEIKSLENQGYNEEQAKVHIKKLHDYNEIKDIAQFVMGRIAEMDGVTLKEVHKNYNAPSKD